MIIIIIVYTLYKNTCCSSSLSHITAKDKKNKRNVSMSVCVCVNQCCEQIAHIFRRKKDCWAEKCELS